MVDLLGTMVYLPGTMVDLPVTMVDLSGTMVNLPGTTIDLPGTMVDLSVTMVDLSGTIVDRPGGMIKISISLDILSWKYVELFFLMSVSSATRVILEIDLFSKDLDELRFVCIQWHPIPIVRQQNTKTTTFMTYKKMFLQGDGYQGFC